MGKKKKVEEEEVLVNENSLNENENENENGGVPNGGTAEKPAEKPAGEAAGEAQESEVEGARGQSQDAGGGMSTVERLKREQEAANVEWAKRIAEAEKKENSLNENENENENRLDENGGVPNGGTGGGLQAEAREVKLGDLPGGMKPNEAKVEQKKSDEVSVSEKKTESSGTVKTSNDIDWDKYNQMWNEMSPGVGNGAQLALKMLGVDSVEELKAKADADKRDADRRRRMHEGVEAIRLLFEGITAGLHGRVVKRDKANYKQYEDEKAKADATYRGAIEKLYQAIASDSKALSDLRAKIMEMAKVTTQTTEKEGLEKMEAEKRGQVNSGSMSHEQSKGTTVHNQYGGKDGVPMYTIKVQKYNEKGERVGQERVTLEFKNKAAYENYIRSAANIVSENPELTERAMTRLKQIYPDITKNEALSAIRDGKFYRDIAMGEDGRTRTQYYDMSESQEQILLDLINDSEELQQVAKSQISNWDKYEMANQTRGYRYAKGGYAVKKEDNGNSNGGAY